MRGEIVKWVRAFGYGYIKPAGSTFDVRCYAEAILSGQPYQGALVELDLADGRAGQPKATNVKVLSCTRR
jgi:cold shock CspA family protein